MTRVDRMDQLLDALRQQMLEKIDTRRSDGAASSQNSADRKVETSTELRQRIGRELRQMDLSSESGRRRARRSFLESVLAWEMGDSILRDPKFSGFLQNLEDAIGRDERSSERLDELLSMMAAAAAP